MINLLFKLTELLNHNQFLFQAEQYSIYIKGLMEDEINGDNIIVYSYDAVYK
jgi:hypothetical protein